MKQPRLLIHVGYPKAASTWLQNEVFSQPGEGFICPWGRRAGAAIDHFVIENAFRFDPQEARDFFGSEIEGAHRKGLVPVLSEETLVGDPVSGRYWGRSVADRLSQTFPDAKILICIREQRAAILSSYKEYVRTGGHLPLERYLGAGVERSGFAGICQLDAFEYDLVIGHYINIFGRDAVLVLTLEELRENARAFIRKLRTFANVDLRLGSIPSTPAANIGFGGATLRMRALLNRYIPPPDWANRSKPYSWRLVDLLSRTCDRLVPMFLQRQFESSLRQRIAHVVGDRYRESNWRTAALVGNHESMVGYDF